MVEDPDGLENAVRILSRLLLAEETLEATLGRVAALACRTLPGCELASVTMIRGGRPSTAVQTAPDRPVGAVNLYSKTSPGFSAADEETALLFSEQAAVACANAEVYWRTYTLTEHLREALESRDVIGQAKGILMARP